MLTSLIIIPTYNEKENIASIIDVVLNLDPAYHILIVDDGSPDGTGKIVHSLIPGSQGRLHILEREGKLGLGTAYIAGFKWGLENGGYDYLIEMDADFSHDPNDLPRLVEACEKGADLSVGSRYVKGGKLVNWGLERKVLSFGGSIYVRLITGMPVMDPTAGFVCYSRKVLESLDLDSIHFVGYAFQIEMKYKSFLSGFQIAEVPITFKDREVGTSKMNSSIIKEAVLGVIRLRRMGLKG